MSGRDAGPAASASSPPPRKQAGVAPGRQAVPSATRSSRSPASRGQADGRGARPRAGVDGWICAALVLATVAVYAPVGGHEFLNYDDDEYVTANPVVRDGLTRAGVVWALTSTHQATWHPLTSLSHLLDVSLFGMQAGAHLWVNVLLHVLAALALFLVLRAMTGARWRSAFVAALFALHPLHVESVAWVSERKDVLSGLFWMLALGCYVAWVRRPSRARYGGLLLVFGLGLLAKPMLVTLPFVLLLLDVWPLGRLARGVGAVAGAAGGPPAGTHASGVRPAGTGSSRVRPALASLVVEKLPLAAMAAGVAAVTLVVQARAGAVVPLAAVPLGARVANALVAYAVYLRKTVWPVDLAVFYPFRAALPAWQVAGATALLAGVTAVAVLLVRRRPHLLVGWLWYLGTLVPVIGLVRQGEQAMADRFTYLPLVGVFIMLAWSVPAPSSGEPAASREPPGPGRGAARGPGSGAPGGTAPAPRARPRASSIGALALGLGAGAALAGCLVLTARQVRVWRDSATLFRHALAVTSENYLAHTNLGVALARAGAYDLAMRHFAEAVGIAPGYAKAQLNFGMALAARGRREEAAARYAEALRLDPLSALAEYNWGVLLAEHGETEAAIARYRRALALDPRYAHAHNNLGSALAARGELDEAIAHYREALRLAPALAPAHNNLAVALEDRGLAAEALAHYAEAARLAPDDPRTRYNLAAALMGAGRADEAAGEYRAAVGLAPELVEARDGLAVAYAAAGRFGEAAATAAEAAEMARRARRPALAAEIERRLEGYRAGRQAGGEPP